MNTHQLTAPCPRGSEGPRGEPQQPSTSFATPLSGSSFLPFTTPHGRGLPTIGQNEKVNVLMTKCEFLHFTLVVRVGKLQRNRSSSLTAG